MTTNARSALTPSPVFTAGFRLYLAPVDRVNGLPVPFDPASMGRFALESPPAGWLDAGAVTDLERVAAAGLEPVLSGAPATVKTQVRRNVEETVKFSFSGWSRVAQALSAGTQTLNLLRTAPHANANPGGGAAETSEPLLAGSTASELRMAATTAMAAGDVVAVDEDYAGETGYLGSGAPGAFVASAPVNGDVHFLRRVTFNVARVLDVSDGVVKLSGALPAGAPSTTMRVSRVMGFADRAGGAFVPEWSALFAMDGFQGDRLLLHYPRLQPVGGGPAEHTVAMAKEVLKCAPVAWMRALPVMDANDGTAAVCFRSYLPAPMRNV